MAVVQLLQLAEALGLEEHEPGSADFVHSIATAWRLAEHTLHWEVGDPDFVDVPLAALTDPQHNAELADRVPMDTVTTLDRSRRDGGLEGNTTHITVVDGDGTVVSMTNTLTNFWGAGTDELGFFLNDQLRRFDIGAGEANEPAPGRRSVSWSAPVLVRDAEGRPILGAGTPGGQRIPIVLAQVIARWALHGEPLEEAVQAPRFHNTGTELETEQPLPADVAEALRARGYTGLTQPELPYYWGSVQVIEIDYDGDELVGATDPRREGAWRAAP